MSLRLEFVTLAGRPEANRAELCRRFGVSRKTGYKWLERYQADGEAGLANRTRRPHRSPTRTDTAVERAVVAIRTVHPRWGGRKIRHFLPNGGGHDLAPDAVPAASTISDILRRHGLLEPQEATARPFVRFEAEAPNRLWQMDFKGHFALDGRTDGMGVRCWPLTLLDDHSRYQLGAEACADERDATVRERLTRSFQRYGLPDAILTDNGHPWGSPRSFPDGRPRLTGLSIWFIRLGIAPLHSRPRHPQTLGKLERLHRSMKSELLQGRRFVDFAAVQAGLDRWRQYDNHHRPHEALGGATPASRYRMSERAMPASLADPTYLDDDLIARVRHNGCLRCRPDGRRSLDLQLSETFAGQLVAVRPTHRNGRFHVWFANYRIAELDLTADPNRPRVTHLFEHL
jgi:transposase InsO family protein